MTEQEIQEALKFFEENYASFGITKRESGEGMTKNGQKFNLADEFEEALKREAAAETVVKTVYSKATEEFGKECSISIKGITADEIECASYGSCNIQAA